MGTANIRGQPTACIRLTNPTCLLSCGPNVAVGTAGLLSSYPAQTDHTRTSHYLLFIGREIVMTSLKLSLIEALCTLIRIA